MNSQMCMKLCSAAQKLVKRFLPQKLEGRFDTNVRCATGKRRGRIWGQGDIAGAARNFLEVEISEVHIAFAEDVHRENALPGRQLYLHEGRCNIPMMPLPPGNGI